MLRGPRGLLRDVRVQWVLVWIMFFGALAVLLLAWP